VALIALTLVAIGVPFIFIVPGITGIMIAAAPLGLLIVLLMVINPYPFWLGYFFLVPILLILEDLFPLGSFTRFFGLFIVVLTIPYILLSKRKANFKVTAVGASLLFFFVGCCLSLLGAWFIEKALLEVGVFLGNLFLYWICVNLFSTEKRLRMVLDLFIFSMMIQSVTAVIMLFYGHPLARAMGTITDPNAFGFWLLPFITISFYLGFGANKWWKKIFYFSAFLFMTLALPLSYSRSMLLIFVPLEVFLFLRFKKPLLGVLLLVAGIGGFYIAFQEYFVMSGLNLMSFFTATRVGSIKWRSHFVLKSVEMFLDRPLFGVGNRCFRYMLPYYAEITPHVYSNVTHNAYLEILSGSGLVGFVPFIAAIIFALRNFWRTRRKHVEKKDRKKTLLAEGLLVAFIAQLGAHFFLSSEHHILLYMFLAFSTIMMNMVLNNKDKDSTLRTA